MDIDDALAIIILLGTIACVAAGLFVALYNYKTYRFIRKLGSDPVLGPKLNLLIEGESGKEE